MGALGAPAPEPQSWLSQLTHTPQFTLAIPTGFPPHPAELGPGLLSPRPWPQRQRLYLPAPPSSPHPTPHPTPTPAGFMEPRGLMEGIPLGGCLVQGGAYLPAFSLHRRVEGS